MNVNLFAIFTFLAWGSGDIFAVIASRKLGGYTYTFWGYIFPLLFSSFYIPFALGDLRLITLGIVLITLFLGLIFLVATVSFYESVRIENPSLAGTITSSFAVLVVLFSVIFLHESISGIQLFFIVLIFLGVIIASLDFKILSKRKIQVSKGVGLALLSMTMYGVYFTFIKIPIKQIGWFWPNYFGLFLFPVLFFYMKIKNIKILKPTYRGAFLPLVIGLIILSTGTFAFNIAIQQGLTAVVAPIAGAYPALFVLLAFIFFKDSISKQQILGIVTTLIGIVLLSYFSA